jgi:hypothetical protein
MKKLADEMLDIVAGSTTYTATVNGVFRVCATTRTEQIAWNSGGGYGGSTWVDYCPSGPSWI